MKRANTMSTITVELTHHRCQISQPARVRRLLSEVNSSYLLTSRPGTMKGHGYVTLPSRQVGAVLGTRTCQPVLRGRLPQRHPGNSEWIPPFYDPMQDAGDNSEATSVTLQSSFNAPMKMLSSLRSKQRRSRVATRVVIPSAKCGSMRRQPLHKKRHGQLKSRQRPAPRILNAFVQFARHYLSPRSFSPPLSLVSHHFSCTARSFNTFDCMLHRTGKLTIDASR